MLKARQTALRMKRSDIVEAYLGGPSLRPRQETQLLDCSKEQLAWHLFNVIGVSWFTIATSFQVWKGSYFFAEPPFQDDVRAILVRKWGIGIF